MDLPLKLEIDGEPKEVVIQSQRLTEALANYVEAEKPTTAKEDFKQFLNQTLPLQLAFDIIKSYPDCFFQSIQDYKRATLYDEFMGQLLRLDPRARHEDGTFVVDTKGEPVRCDKWYWKIDERKQPIGCGKFVLNNSTIQFLIGEKHFPILKTDRFAWAIGP